MHCCTCSKRPRRFVDFYDRNTSADPLLLGDEWQFLQWDDRGSKKEHASYDELWGGRALRLHQLSARLAESYEALTAVAAPNALSQRTPKILIER